MFFWVVTSALYLVARVRVLTADAMVLLGHCYVVARQLIENSGWSLVHCIWLLGSGC